MSATPEQIDRGIWRWTARHPEWHPAGFGDEVACFALETDTELLLIDPLLPVDPAPCMNSWIVSLPTESRS